MRGEVCKIGVNRIALTQDGQKIQQFFRENRKFPITEQLMKQASNAGPDTKFEIVIYFRSTNESVTYLDSIAPKRRDIKCGTVSPTEIEPSGLYPQPIDPNVVIGLKIQDCTVSKLLSYITNPQNSSIARIDIVSGEWSLLRANMTPFRSSETNS